jgi:hypothetical protein
MPISNYLANAVINAAVRNTAYTSPTTVYAALYSTNNSPSAAGTELSGNGYSRQSVTFSAPSAGAAVSNVSVTFTATGNWTPVTSIAIVDASSSGNVLWYKNISTQVVNSGQSISLTGGNISVTVS